MCKPPNRCNYTPNWIKVILFHSCITEVTVGKCVSEYMCEKENEFRSKGVPQAILSQQAPQIRLFHLLSNWPWKSKHEITLAQKSCRHNGLLQGWFCIPFPWPANGALCMLFENPSPLFMPKQEAFLWSSPTLPWILCLFWEKTDVTGRDGSFSQPAFPSFWCWHLKKVIGSLLFALTSVNLQSHSFYPMYGIEIATASTFVGSLLF